jgi:hypothetical protein
MGIEWNLEMENKETKALRTAKTATVVKIIS